VPRRNLKFASSFIAVIIQGPKRCFFGSAPGVVQRLQGRVRWKFQTVVALEGGGEFGGEFGRGVEARHLVFVLVGQQLVVAAGDGFGERRAGTGAGFGGAHALDQGLVALGIGFVLVGREMLAAAGDDGIQVAGEGRRCLGGVAGQQGLDSGRVVGGAAAPVEGAHGCPRRRRR
jgi:hypothetical protein